MSRGEGADEGRGAKGVNLDHSWVRAGVGFAPPARHQLMSMIPAGGCGGVPAVAAASVVSLGSSGGWGMGFAGQPGAGIAVIRADAVVMWLAQGQLAGMRSHRLR